MKEPQFDTLEKAQNAYTRMRLATTDMSRLNLELLGVTDVEDAKGLLGQFDDAVDRFIAANAELQRAGFWAAKDAMYLPPGVTARGAA